MSYVSGYWNGFKDGERKGIQSSSANVAALEATEIAELKERLNQLESYMLERLAEVESRVTSIEESDSYCGRNP